MISGSGAVQQLGPGTTTLTANNTYTGGTLVNAGILQLGAGASLAAVGALTVNGGVFNLNGNNQTVGALAGTGGVIALGSGTLTAGDASSTTLAAAISGTGGFIKQGSGALTLTGASGYTGGTVVNAGTLVVNGSLASAVTVNGGRLQGSGTVGGLVVNSGVVAPGNSIGTLTVNGSFVQASGSTYQVEVNSAGQSDRINVGGAATINGGTVQVLAQSGTYARNTTYTILNAAGGVSGTYSSVTQQLRLPDAHARLRRQQRVPDPVPVEQRLRGGRADAQPVRRRRGARSGQSHRDRRPRRGAECDERAQHAAGAGRAERPQRPALCRFRHAERAGRRAVHERARPADGGRAGRRLRRRPAPGAGPGLRDRELRRRGPVGRLGKRAGRAGQRRRQRQLIDDDLQFRRRRGRHRLSRGPALSRRHRCRLHRGQPVGRQLHGPRLVRQRERRGLRFVHAGRASTRTLSRATPITTTRCSARS